MKPEVSDFAEEGPVEGLELVDELLFASSEVIVAHVVETRAMVKFRQMGKFVAYDVVT